MYGITQFTAIVNPIMGAILALGKATQQVVEDGEQRVATMLNATLSCDHRVIDGAVGALPCGTGEVIAAPEQRTAQHKGEDSARLRREFRAIPRSAQQISQ